MIDVLSVSAFKSIEDVEINLGHVNLFVGANGSGKSNLLEALGVLSAAASGRVDDESLLRRGVRPGLPALYKTSLRGRKLPQQITLAARTGEALYRAALWNPITRPKPAWTYHSESLDDGGRHIVGRSPRSRVNLDPYAGYAALQRVTLRASEAAGVLIDELQAYAIYAPDTATLRGLVPDTQSRPPVGLRGGRLAEAFEEVRRSDRAYRFRPVQSVLELIGWARAVGTGLPSNAPISPSVARPNRVVRFMDRFMRDGRNVLSGYDASEGALYVLFATVLAHHPDTPPIFAVDNFDHALNPRLARNLTTRICEWLLDRGDRQALLTSHNPLVLDGLPLRDDRVRLFAVDRSFQGRTQVRRVVVDDKVLASAEKGIPLSQQWVMGHFGGVPQDV